MNTSKKNNNQSWKSSITDKLVAFLVTWNQKNNKKYYRSIICGALPEVLEQNKNNQDALDFILHRWLLNVSDTEIGVVSKLLKRAIKLAKNGWLITLGIGSVLVLTGTGLIILINNSEEITVRPPILLGKQAPDCLQKKDCILIADLANVIDKISPDFNTGKLTVKFTANGTSDDHLNIRNQDIDGTVIGSFTEGTLETPLEITFNANATREKVQDVVRNITYKNTSENPVIGFRTVEFQLTDGDGGISKPFTININVIPTQQDISIDEPTAQTLKENENSAITPLKINAPDNQKITVTLQVNNGTVKVKPDVTGGLTEQEIKNNQTKNVTLTGTATKINTTLGNSTGLLYQGNQNFSGKDSLNITANVNNVLEGLVWPPNAQNVDSVSKNVSITINSINPPSFIAVPRSQVTNQNQNLSIPGINISDPNNESVTVILKVSQGNLTVKTDVSQGLSANNIKNNKTKEVTLNGQISSINNTFQSPDGILYKSQTIGEDSLEITVKDGKNTINKTVNIVVNDNPIITVPEFLVTSYGKLTKQDALNIVESWLEAKNNIMQSPYDIDLLGQYTTGIYYNGKDGQSGRLGSVRWLIKTGSYYRFGSPKVISSGKFIKRGEDILIEAKVEQSFLFYNGELGTTQTSEENDKYRWTLRFEDNQWKIADSQKID